MISDIKLKTDKNRRIGEGREYLVSQFVAKRYKWKVYASGFVMDVLHQVDIIAHSDDGLNYIQVKGFHKNWRDEKFEKLLKKAEEDNARAYAMYVTKNGRIYVRSLKWDHK